MDEINLTEAEARELRRVQRKASAITLGLIVMAALGSILGVVAFQVWRASTRGNTAVHVDGDVMFLPVIIVVTAIVILAPQRQAGQPTRSNSSWPIGASDGCRECYFLKRSWRS